MAYGTSFLHVLALAAVLSSSFAVNVRRIQNADLDTNTSDVNFCNRTDVVFVVQNNEALMDSLNLEQMKLFMQGLINAYGLAIPLLDAYTVRFAAIHYAASVVVAFDFNAGYSLEDTVTLNAAIDSITYSPVAGANLAGALIAAQNMLLSQSDPLYNQVVIILSDARDDNGPGGLEAVSDWFFDNFVSVVAIGYGDVDPDNLSELVHHDDAHMMAYHYDYPLSEDLDLLQWTSKLICRYWKFCMTEVSICSKTCGIGTYNIIHLCIIYVDGNPMDERRYEVEKQCCLRKCPHNGNGGGRGNHNGTNCHDLPPGGSINNAVQ